MTLQVKQDQFPLNADQDYTLQISRCSTLSVEVYSATKLVHSNKGGATDRPMPKQTKTSSKKSKTA